MANPDPSSSLTYQSPNTWHLALSTALFALIYFIVRLPTAHLNLAYYDDGETLYHTLAILKGKTPYLQDYNHHFEGYVVPFILGAKMFGFSPFLIKQVAFINQVLTALGVYCCVRLISGKWLGLLAGLLYITAREPFVLGFHPQYQINCIYVFILYLSLLCLKQAKLWISAVAFLLSGLVFVIDQRALALAIIPISAVILAPGQLTPKKAIINLILLTIFPLFSIVFLIQHAAFQHFVEQTIIYPASFRSASKPISTVLYDALILHKYLVSQTPVLLTFAVIGLLELIRLRPNSTGINSSQRNLLFVCLLPLLAMPSFGARDFDYYTVTWLPFMAILAGLSWNFFKPKFPKLKSAYYFMLGAPVLFSIYSSVHTANEVQDYKGDGIIETVSFLKENLKPEDSLFVWGYRMDVYGYLGRVSAYPFGSTIFIQPDSQIKDPDARLKHVFPKYEKEFLELLQSSPPRVVVTFTRQGSSEPSLAGQKLQDKLTSEYSQLFEIKKKDFLGKECIFKVYRKR